MWFCAAIVLVLSCKAVLSLTVAAMGLWLLCFDKKRNCGLIALFLGVGWFLVATQAVIPYFNQGRETRESGDINIWETRFLKLLLI